MSYSNPTGTTAGAYIAQDWDFPDELAAAIATHHDEPASGQCTGYTIVQVSWRLADTLGYAAFSPDKLWSFEDLIAFLPRRRESWLCESPEVAKVHIDELLAASPL